MTTPERVKVFGKECSYYNALHVPLFGFKKSPTVKVVEVYDMTSMHVSNLRVQRLKIVHRNPSTTACKTSFALRSTRGLSPQTVLATWTQGLRIATFHLQKKSSQGRLIFFIVCFYFESPITTCTIHQCRWITYQKGALLECAKTSKALSTLIFMKYALRCT